MSIAPSRPLGMLNHNCLTVLSVVIASTYWAKRAIFLRKYPLPSTFLHSLDMSIR